LSRLIGSTSRSACSPGYSQVDTRAGNGADTEAEQIDVGVNFWPHRNVVLKADYQFQNDVAGDDDRINLGVGYQF
jgi:hypothetical protein